MPFVFKKVLDHGTTNPIVARLSLQVLKILDPCDVTKDVRDICANPPLDIAEGQANRALDVLESPWLQREVMMLREKLVKIGAKIVRYGRYATFQMAEVAVPRDLFREILRPIDDLRPSPTPA